MSVDTDKNQTFDESQVRRDARRRGYVIGGGVVALIAALVVLVIWPLVDRTVYLRDDRGLGERFSTEMHLDGYGCERLAEVLYDHGVRPYEGYTSNDDGWAPRSEKAFYAGCTGTDVYFGGGGGD